MTLNSIADEPYFATTASKTGVQTLYSENTLRGYLTRLYEAGRSLRQIASDFGPPITHADIQRALRGEFPKNAEKRAALGLPSLLQVNVYILVALIVYFKPPRPRIYHRWRDMPTDALKWALENRV